MATQLKKVKIKGWSNLRNLTIQKTKKFETSGIFIEIISSDCRCSSCYNRLEMVTKFATKNDSDFIWHAKSLMTDMVWLHNTEVAIQIPLSKKNIDWKTQVKNLLGIEIEREEDRQKF